MNLKKVFVNSSLTERISFLSICFIYACHGTVFNGIPFMFYRPDFICLEDGIEISCSEEKMCSLKEANNDTSDIFKFDSYNSINSIPIEYNLFCDKKYMEAEMQTLCALGQLCGFILSLIWDIPSSKKKRVILGILYTESACLISLTVFDSLISVNFALFAQNICFSYFYALLFVFITEQFSKEMSEFAPILTNFLWAATMLTYIMFAYFVSNWRLHLIEYGGIPILIVTLIFHYFIAAKERNLSNNIQQPLLQQEMMASSSKKIKHQDVPLSFIVNIECPNKDSLPSQIDIVSNQSNEILMDKNIQPYLECECSDEIIMNTFNQKEKCFYLENSCSQNDSQIQEDVSKNEHQSLLQQLKERMKEIYYDKRQYKNLLVYILCNAGCYTSYYGVYISLNRLQGNLYVNSFVSTLFELSGGISAALLIARFNHKQILFYTYMLIGFAYLSCIVFQPANTSQISTIGLIISLLPIIIAKCTHEMLFPIFILYLPKILKQKYHQFAFAAANLVGVFTMNILPFYQYFMEKYELNQFIGYGLLMFMIVYQIANIQELPPKNEQKKDNHEKEEVLP